MNYYDTILKTWKAKWAFSNDSAHVVCGGLAMGPIYEDATYKYYGEASPGIALTAALWRVSRMKISDKQVEWADGDSKFDNVFTDLSIVAALSYS